MATKSRDVLDRIDRDKESYLEELKEYLRIPSISTDPEYRPQVIEASDFLLGKMRDAGLDAEKIDNGGNPLVYGEWTKAPGRPTVLFYGHYDVQPADPLEEWRNPPFEPTEEGDHLIARGATDDKGQSYTHLKAVAALLAERGELPVNVKFLVEGEEESGGESIERFVREDGGKRLAADCVIVSDTSMLAPDQPSMIYGLKGMAYFEIRVHGPNRDLHSGTFGGAVRNPMNALCHIISRLKDPETGKVLVPGFYDDVAPLEEWEREEFGKLAFDEEAYRRNLDVPELFGEEGYTVRERTWARPTCDVHGLFGGYMAKGAKTIIPARGGAKVSMRLVPNQDPEEITRRFTDYIHQIAPSGVRVEVEFIHGAEPVVMDASGPLIESALGAMEEVWGASPVRIREGGSIPIVATLNDVLGAPVLLLGFGLPDDGLHSPNEKFNISHYYKGIRSIARILDAFESVDPGAL